MRGKKDITKIVSIACCSCPYNTGQHTYYLNVFHKAITNTIKDHQRFH